MSRRRVDVQPQEAPAWQKTLLEAVKKRESSQRKSPSGSASRSKVKNGKKCSSPPAKKRQCFDGAEAVSRSDSSERSDAAEIESTDSDVAPKKKRKTNSKASKTATPTSSKGRVSLRVKVAELTCSQCKLRVDQWPFCGITGAAHVNPNSSEADAEVGEAAG